MPKRSDYNPDVCFDNKDDAIKRVDKFREFGNVAIVMEETQGKFCVFIEKNHWCQVLPEEAPDRGEVFGK